VRTKISQARDEYPDFDSPCGWYYLYATTPKTAPSFQLDEQQEPPLILEVKPPELPDDQSHASSVKVKNISNFYTIR
jgi:hypothetical protein